MIKTPFKTTASFAIALAICTTQDLRAAVIIDGDFESPIVPGTPGSRILYPTGGTFGGGWRVDSAVVGVALKSDGDPDFLPTPDGNQFVYLGQNISVSTLAQDISGSLFSGTIYTVSFLQSGFASLQFPGRVRLQVTPTSGGATIYDNTFVLPIQSPWVTQAAVFPVTTTGSYTVKFTSFNSAGGIIDRVAIVPEPTAFLLTGVGAVFIGLQRKSRNKGSLT